VPAAGETIRVYLETFLNSIGGLTLAGTIVLIVTALLLMFRIEVAFNKIWRVTEQRSITNRIVMYWAVLTLCPILIGAAAALGAQNLLAAFHLQEGVAPGIQRFGIFLLMWLTFSLIFVLVPNRKVKVRDAIAGAFLTAILFEIAKAGFVAYVKNANYTVIYGALATVPIFLFWLYLVWSVVLFGASLAASLTTFKDQSRVDNEWPERLDFQLAYRLVGHLWEAQRQGKSLFVSDIMALEVRGSEMHLRDLLLRLMEADVVTHHPDDGWVLLRDLEDFTFGDLQNAGAFYMPLAESDDCPQDSKWDNVFRVALADLKGSGEEVLETPLRRMFRPRSG
jgi:membrane protein